LHQLDGQYPLNLAQNDPCHGHLLLQRQKHQQDVHFHSGYTHHEKQNSHWSNCYDKKNVLYFEQKSYDRNNV
jgi:hypothetical protein